MTTLSATAATRPGLFDRLRARIAAWRAEAARRAAYRETRAQLAALDDRELDDLGIARWEIDRAARRAVYGR